MSELNNSLALSGVALMLIALIYRAYVAYCLWREGLVPWTFMLISHNLPDGRMLFPGAPYTWYLSLIGFVLMLIAWGSYSVH